LTRVTFRVTLIELQMITLYERLINELFDSIVRYTLFDNTPLSIGITMNLIRVIFLFEGDLFWRSKALVTNILKTFFTVVRQKA
jgi:hypothetical protein